MDRSVYKKPFFADKTPPWKCPTCGSGHLALIENSLYKFETSKSRADRKHDEWHPEWINFVFSCIFRCDRSRCGEPVACSGVVEIDLYEPHFEDGWEAKTFERLRPYFFQPSLNLMDFPNKCPVSVKEYAKSSFGLFFYNQSAALNFVRKAVEALLNDLEEKHSIAQPKKGFVTLDDRIKRLPDDYKASKDHLLAIKWLGNAGSHVSKEADFDDVISAYEMLEHALYDIYENRSEKLKNTIRLINANKGFAR